MSSLPVSTLLAFVVTGASILLSIVWALWEKHREIE